MYPSIASSPADICFNCTYDELFICFERMMKGSPLPSNVINDVNPYKFFPANLPGGVWYLISSKESTEANHGLWKSKEETCEVHSSSTIIGWKATLEYYDGQAPYEHKTNWVMEVFSITLKTLSQDSIGKEGSLLCKVFLNHEQSANCEMQQKTPRGDVATEDATILGSTRKPNVNKDDRTGVLAITEKTPDLHLENLHETVQFRDGDYLELADLDDPASSSSSSENSSLRSMSSDECFDSLAFLRELECGTDVVQEQKITGFKFDVSGPGKANEIVTLPATLGSTMHARTSNSPIENIPEVDASMPVLAAGCSRGLENKITTRSQKREHEGEISSSEDFNLHASCSSQKTAKDGGNKGSAGRMKRLRKKYLCFMPF